MRKLALFWAHFFLLGFFPIFPATFTSAVVSLLFGLWLIRLGLIPRLILVGFVFITGIPAASKGERYHGKKDPRSVVIDEVAGQLLALVPARNWTEVFLGFLLFRLFDTLKPPPVNLAERIEGGPGIMLDDLAAGAMALSILLLIHSL